MGKRGGGGKFCISLPFNPFSLWKKKLASGSSFWLSAFSFFFIFIFIFLFIFSGSLSLNYSPPSLPLESNSHPPPPSPTNPQAHPLPDTNSSDTIVPADETCSFLGSSLLWAFPFFFFSLLSFKSFEERELPSFSKKGRHNQYHTGERVR